MTFEAISLSLAKLVSLFLALAIGAYALEKKKYYSFLLIGLIPLQQLTNVAKWPDFLPLLVTSVLGVIFIATRKPYVFPPEDYGSDALYWITQIALASLDYLIHIVVGSLIYILLSFMFNM